jgi:hypothetical protein
MEAQLFSDAIVDRRPWTVPRVTEVSIDRSRDVKVVLRIDLDDINFRFVPFFLRRLSCVWL